MNTKRKYHHYSDQERLNAINLVLKEGYSTNEVANNLGTSHELIRRWVNHYEKFGLEGFKKECRVYSKEFKLGVIQDLKKNHLSLHQTAIMYLISESTIHSWLKKYLEKGLSGLIQDNRGRKPIMKPNKPKKLKSRVEKTTTQEELLLENERLRAENAYLKKLQTLIQEHKARENGSVHKPFKN